MSTACEGDLKVICCSYQVCGRFGVCKYVADSRNKYLHAARVGLWFVDWLSCCAALTDVQ